MSRRSRSTHVLLAVSLAVSCTGSLAHGELLINGDFNTDVDAAPGMPDYWYNWSYGPTAFAAYKNNPTDSFTFDGSNYVNAGNYGDWWSSGAGWFQVVPGTAGQAYSFSAWCATENWDNMAGELRTIYLDGAAPNWAASRSTRPSTCRANLGRRLRWRRSRRLARLR
ncbi:MAG: hypothetical protein QM770_15910 [Tepidisphaeraceae bacterium]